MLYIINHVSLRICGNIKIWSRPMEIFYSWIGNNWAPAPFVLVVALSLVWCVV